MFFCVKFPQMKRGRWIKHDLYSVEKYVNAECMSKGGVTHPGFVLVMTSSNQNKTWWIRVFVLRLFLLYLTTERLQVWIFISTLSCDAFKLAQTVDSSHAHTLCRTCQFRRPAWAAMHPAALFMRRCIRLQFAFLLLISAQKHTTLLTFVAFMDSFTSEDGKR